LREKIFSAGLYVLETGVEKMSWEDDGRTRWEKMGEEGAQQGNRSDRESSERLQRLGNSLWRSKKGESEELGESTTR